MDSWTRKFERSQSSEESQLKLRYSSANTNFPEQKSEGKEELKKVKPTLYDVYRRKVSNPVENTNENRRVSIESESESVSSRGSEVFTKSDAAENEILIKVNMCVAFSA